jgi:uncharacterized protein YndB with AHSA1/START domain
MTTTAVMAQKASTIKKAFSRETTVSINIEADASIVWTLLTNAADFPRWNSTIVSMEGEIKLGEKIKLKSILDEKRTFKLKVKEFEPDKQLVWGDGKGKRVYTITKQENGVTFTMTEKIGGLMFPMYAKYIPPFDESFEQFAADLKKESEIISQTK